MAEEFSTDGMLDIYLFENEQLLEQLQERVLDQKDTGLKYSQPLSASPMSM